MNRAQCSSQENEDKDHSLGDRMSVLSGATSMVSAAGTLLAGIAALLTVLLR